MSGVPDLSGLFEEEASVQIDDKISAVRNLLRDYQHGREMEANGRKAAKEAKLAIEKLFAELPDEVKTVVNDKPTNIGGQVFQRVRKVIELDGWLIILKQRVDTTFDRKTVFSIMEREPRSGPSADRDVARRVVESLMNKINRTMQPHLTDVIVVERKRGRKSSSRPL